LRLLDVAALRGLIYRPDSFVDRSRKKDVYGFAVTTTWLATR